MTGRQGHSKICFRPALRYSFQDAIPENSIEVKVVTIDVSDMAATRRVWARLSTETGPNIIVVDVSDHAFDKMTTPDISIAVDGERG